MADDAYLQACIAAADHGQQCFGDEAPGSAVAVCASVRASVEQIVIIPRKPDNIFVPNDRCVRTLLPERYPGNSPIKQIESNFYPDLNTTRTITAVVTTVPWSPELEHRPPPLPGTTVYFALGGKTTAEVTLSTSSATTDAEGRASVDVTVNKLLTTKAKLEVANKIEVLASLSPACAPGSPSVELTLHRNEDVDDPLGPAETPQDFAATLAPVLDLTTWIVRQGKDELVSHGAIAVQQLLNQVACRNGSGTHAFCRPDGKFGTACGTELGRFIDAFATAPVAGNGVEVARDNYTHRRFGVSVEEDPARGQGVKTYVRLEYGAYAEGQLVDAHLLTGLEPWQAGGAIVRADGLLDLYTAVVWEFIQAMNVRAGQYADAAVTWCRHPGDGASGGADAWPATVTQGVAYWYGGARTQDEFIADAGAARATPPAGLDHWLQYLNANNRRIGLHGSGDNIAVPNNLYNQYAHLNTDADVTGNPHVLHHPYIDRVKRQYTGIDCSAFCQRIALEAKFRLGHCTDLPGQPICGHLPAITHNNGLATNRLSTTSWTQHYREMPSATWRREVAFRGDVLNSAGHHIVAIDTDDRPSCSGVPQIGSVWIYHACGETTKPAALNGIWDPTECIRRVVRSPLRQWGTGWTSWSTNTNAVRVGRIYLWA